MAELFGEYNRPKAEKKVIANFIKLYNQASKEYKSKNYSKASELFTKGYDLLKDIWDNYPKVLTLYYIMKSYYYNKQYDSCEETLIELNNMVHFIEKEKPKKFLKIKSKLFLYSSIINFIYDDLDKSLNSVIEMINYLANSKTLSLVEKSYFYWNYIKSFLKLSDITKTIKFDLFKEEYDSMIVEENNIVTDKWGNTTGSPEPVKKVERYMVDEFKSFLNVKLKKIIYDILDNEFYYVKYKKINDKVMIFLQKNMSMYVRDNNKQKLLEKFHTFIVLNRTDIKKEFNCTVNDLLHEQKTRILTFDSIYASIVGSFNYIFKKYYNNEFSNPAKPLSNRGKGNFLNDMNQLKKRMKIRLCTSRESTKRDKRNSNFNKTNPLKTYKTELDFKAEIKIPPIGDDEDKTNVIINDYKNKCVSQRYLSVSGNTKYIENSKKYFSIKNNNNEINKDNDYKFFNNFFNKDSLKLPKIKNDNMGKVNERNNLFLYCNSNRLSKISPTEIKSRLLENNSILSSKNNASKNITVFKFRNINNYFLVSIIQNFTDRFKILNDIKQEDDEVINYSSVYPRKKDLYDFHYDNVITSYFSKTVKNKCYIENETQYTFFYYENYLLIKNLFFFGIFDGHGKNGYLLSKKLCVLFPSYLLYIIIDDNLLSNKKDLNIEMQKLCKLCEPSSDIKEMFILRYFFEKFEIDFSYIPFLSNHFVRFFNQIYETIHYCHNELRERYKIDISTSGATLCSCLIFNNNLYVINLGNSKVIKCSYNYIKNKWSYNQLSFEHKPNNPEEYKRITTKNAKVERLKNEFGEEYGEFRIFKEDSDTLQPGLSMSRSIGDEDSKKIGVIYKPNLYKYELNSEDKIIIIGSESLWKNLSNDEVTDIASKCYENGDSCEEMTELIIEAAKNNKIEENCEKNKKINKGENNVEEEINFMKKRKLFDDITCSVVYLNVK